MPSRELVHEWANFLNRWEWQGFWTLTFKHDYTVWAARRALLRWALRWTLPAPDGPSFIFFLEWQQFGRVHFHGLTRNEIGPRIEMWSDWKERHGLARSESYNPSLGANYYCAKYLTKADGETILDERRINQWPARMSIGNL